MSLFEVGVPFRLVAGDTTELDFALEDPGLVIESVESTADVRQEIDDLPLADGAIIQPAFRSYRLTTIRGRIGALDGFDNRRSGLQDLNTILMQFLRSDSRLYWTPRDYGDERMLIGTRLSEALIVGDHPQLGPTVKAWSFQLATPDAAIYDSTQQTTTIEAGDTAIITNLGNGPGWPTARVYPDTGFDFTLVNSAQDRFVRLGSFSSDATFLEVGMFSETIYEDGDGTNRLPYLFPLVSDFWSLDPGDNEIGYSGDGGGHVDILWNNSWA